MALTAVRAYFFVLNEFVNINKFEATYVMTGFFQQKDPSWCAVVVNSEAWMGTGTYSVSHADRKAISQAWEE